MNNKFVWTLFFITMLLAGCEPISIPDPPTDYNRLATVYALVSPDSVFLDQRFRVQVGYAMACGGELTELRVLRNGNRLVYSPVLHVTPTDNCGDISALRTAIDSTTFPELGTHFISTSSNKGVLKKRVDVVAEIPFSDPYLMKFIFVDSTGIGVRGYTSQLQFPDRAPGRSYTIVADSAGVWDTSFYDTAPSIRYILAGVQLRAKPYVKEAGIVAIY